MIDFTVTWTKMRLTWIHFEQAQMSNEVPRNLYFSLAFENAPAVFSDGGIVWAIHLFFQ